MPRASLRTIGRQRRKSRSEQRFRRTSASRKFLLAGDTNTLRASPSAADIESRTGDFWPSYPRKLPSRDNRVSRQLKRRMRLTRMQSRFSAKLDLWWGSSGGSGKKAGVRVAAVKMPYHRRVRARTGARKWACENWLPGFCPMTFPSTRERARILTETNAVPCRPQTGVWLPTADLGMLRPLRCVGCTLTADRGVVFGADGTGTAELAEEICFSTKSQHARQ